MEGSTVRVLLTGGGSGGHVYPLLAVADALKKIAAAEKFSLEMCYLGPKERYAGILVSAGIETGSIISGKFRRYASIDNLIDIPKFFMGMIQAFFKVYLLMPDVIFSKGGTGALPVVIAGWFYMIPVIIHESDATPGLTNLLSSRFATRIAVRFERALKYFNPKKTALTGTPIRKDLLSGHLPMGEAKESLGFNSKEPLILILGGSMGSERINEFVLTNLENFIKEGQILHQTGAGNFAEAEKLARVALINVPASVELKNRYKPVPYLEIEDLKTALAAADLVVARSGSGTISELAAFAKPSILIPLRESAGDHQRINAYEFAKTGAAIVIEESNLLPGIFLGQIRSILKNPSISDKMSLASGNFFRGGSAETIARELLAIAS